MIKLWIPLYNLNRFKIPTVVRITYRNMCVYIYMYIYICIYYLYICTYIYMYIYIYIYIQHHTTLYNIPNPPKIPDLCRLLHHMELLKAATNVQSFCTGFVFCCRDYMLYAGWKNLKVPVMPPIFVEVNYQTHRVWHIHTHRKILDSSSTNNLPYKPPQNLSGQWFRWHHVQPPGRSLLSLYGASFNPQDDMHATVGHHHMAHFIDLQSKSSILKRLLHLSTVKTTSVPPRVLRPVLQFSLLSIRLTIVKSMRNNMVKPSLVFPENSFQKPSQNWRSTMLSRDLPHLSWTWRPSPRALAALDPWQPDLKNHLHEQSRNPWPVRDQMWPIIRHLIDTADDKSHKTQNHYPLVMTNKKLWKITIFNGSSTINGHFQ